MKKNTKKQTKRIIDDLENISFAIRDVMHYESLDDYHDGIIEIYAGLDPVERIAVGVHAFIEMVLLHLKGITDEQITKWDTEDSNGAFNAKMYDKNNTYKQAHQFAEFVEKEIIEWSGRSWDHYDKHTDKIKIKWKRKEVK